MSIDGTTSQFLLLNEATIDTIEVDFVSVSVVKQMVVWEHSQYK